MIAGPPIPTGIHCFLPHIPPALQVISEEIISIVFKTSKATPEIVVSLIIGGLLYKNLPENRRNQSNQNSLEAFFSKIPTSYIFWTGGFDSTFLVCKKLIIERKPIETYYLNFPCDGYQKDYNKFVSTNFDKCMLDNETNVVEEDPYGRKSYGRFSRLVEVGIMNKLREMIIDKFPYTEDIFPFFDSSFIELLNTK